MLQQKSLRCSWLVAFLIHPRVVQWGWFQGSGQDVSSSTPTLTNYVFMELTLWTGLLSRWTRIGPLRLCSHYQAEVTRIGFPAFCFGQCGHWNPILPKQMRVTLDPIHIRFMALQYECKQLGIHAAFCLQECNEQSQQKLSVWHFCCLLDLIMYSRQTGCFHPE